MHLSCVLREHKQIAGFIRRKPPPTFSDTAITDTTVIRLFPSSEPTGCGYPHLLDRKIVRICATGGSQTLDFLRKQRTPTLSTRPGAPRLVLSNTHNGIPQVSQRYISIMHTPGTESVYPLPLQFQEESFVPSLHSIYTFHLL